MIVRPVGAFIATAILLLAFRADAQEGPLTLSRPYAIHTVTGPNPGSRYVPGDVMRIGVFANHSEQPTTVVATQGDVRIDLPFYRGPILDDLFDANVPFEPTMVGPWTITVTRGAETASIEAPGVPGPFTPALLENLRIETVDGVATLMWLWPDLSDARTLGLTPLAKILVMQEDNHDELLLNFGLRDNPIVIGGAGEPAAVPIPDELEEGKLYVFRVHLQFMDGAGNMVAQSVTFVPKLQPGT
ncbi:MAG: hypothetical protein ACWA6X_01515 [Bauldia sp.]